MSEQRRYPVRPLLGVSAIIRRGREVLLIQRGREPLKGVWSFPGGLVQAGESLDKAVRRELAEETGIQARFSAPPELKEILRTDGEGRAEHHYVLVVFAGEYKRGEARAGGDAGAVRWVSHEEARLMELTDGALELIARFTRD